MRVDPEQEFAGGSSSTTAPVAPYLAVLCLVAVGIGLRLASYFANRAVIIDEAALARSLRDHSWRELLTQPLEAGQAAPPGFLLAEKAILALWGDHEFALRFFPVSAGVLSVVLFALLARRTLGSAGTLAALACFAAGEVLVYYSAEIKPYSFDALAAIVILLWGLVLRSGVLTTRRALAFGAACGLLTCFAVPTLFVGAAVGLSILLESLHRRDWSAVRALLAGGVLAALLAAPAVLAMARTISPEGLAYHRDFWGGGFIPLQPRSVADALWLPVALLRFTIDPLGVWLAPIALATIIGGARVWWRRDRTGAAMLILPVVLTLFASALREYPFSANDHRLGTYDGRVLLFLVPGGLLLLGSGVDALWNARTMRRRAAALSLAGTLTLSAWVPTLARFPFEREPVRDSMAYLAAHRQPDDLIYVFYRARHSFDYYAPRYGLDRALISAGSCARNDPVRYLPELQSLRAASRVWVVFFNTAEYEADLVVRFMDMNGTRLAASPGGTRSSGVALYQMRSNVAAERFPPASAYDLNLNPRLALLACRGMYEKFRPLSSPTLVGAIPAAGMNLR